MKKRLMPTAIAFVVLALLLVYANYYETEEILPPGQQKPVKIVECARNEVTAITWKRGDADLKVAINASDTKIVAPAEYISDQKEIDGLLRHFTELKSELIISENATDTSVYGINASSPVVVIEAENREWQLTLGDKTEVGGSYYLTRKDDPRVFMVPGYINGDFVKTLDNLRDRRFFVEDFGQISNISHSTPESTIELRLGDSLTDWFIGAPASYPADGVAVSGLIENMRNLKIAKFIDDNPSADDDYGFASSSLKIVVVNKDGKEITLETGEMSGTETYVRTSGSQAIHTALTTDINNLRVTVNDLREKYLSVPAYADLTELTVADASGSITVERKGDKWLVGDQLVAERDVKDFVLAADRARVNVFGNLEKLEKHGLAKKEQCRTIEIKSNTERLMLWLGMRDGANLSAMSDNELLIMTIELDDAFKTFMRRLRQPSEETKTVVSTSDTPTVATDTNQ